jgi:hypothetical protein
MARPEKQRPHSLEEAVADLKRDPAHPVHARIDGLEVELRVVDAEAADSDDIMGGAGPWQGESTEELLRILKEARDRGERPPPGP